MTARPACRFHAELRLRHAVWWAVAACGALAACSPLAPLHAPSAALDIPAGWSQADAAGGGAPAAGDAALAEWWRRFDDPTLDELVDRALQVNTSVQRAQAALWQAQALRDGALSSMGPSVDASASAQRGMAGGQGTGNSLRLGLDATWVIDVFGARRAALQAAEAGVDSGDASLADAQAQVVAEVALNYILLRSAQARTGIAQGNLASQIETLQITQWRQQAGLVGALQTEQARAAVAQNQAQLPMLEAATAQAGHALAVLAGRPPAALAALLVPGPAVPQLRDGPDLDVPAEALRRRADVRAAEHQVAAALARVGQAQAQRWPSFSIGGTLGLSGATLGALGSAGAAFGSLLAGVTLPVFDGGALRAQVRQQQAALAQADQAYRAAVLAALQQVEDALAALRADRLRLASLRVAADAADIADTLARQRYGSGLVDFQTVLETQRTRFATQDGLATAGAELGSDHVRLFRALGGGWSPRPTLTRR